MFCPTPLLLELLNMGAGSAVTPPIVISEAIGWYAADDGLVIAWSGPRYKDSSDAIRIWMDFCPLQEIREGDAIDLASVIATGVSSANVAISGNRVFVTIYGGVSFTECSVKFTITLSSGSVVARSGIVRISPGGASV